jgi:Rrf2 family transcriptional regulator, nitric oxide-sensitive transcriptional repressor
MSVISQTAEYALRAVVFLAHAEGGPRTTDEIAKATEVKREYLSKVLQELRRSGLVSARPGSGGGFQLKRSPAQMTVLDVVAAVDPLQRITKCPLQLASHDAKLCRLHARLDSAIDAVETAFRETTIDELVPDRPLRSNRCPFPVRPTSLG